jgi:hypothetical protein
MDADDHVFISYVREDSDLVDRLQSALERAGLTVWRDTGDLRPGVFWEVEIRKAVITRSLAFVACFSQNTELRRTTFQNEELIIAVEHMRLLAPGTTWLIPARFSDCAIPAFPLGAGRTLTSLQHIDLFDDRWDRGIISLVDVVAHADPRGVPITADIGPGSAHRGVQLKTGQALYRGQYIMSDDNRFVLALRYDGNIVLYGPGRRQIWSSGTEGKAGTQLAMQADGNLVLYTPPGAAVWASNTDGSGASQLTMQADGNAVLYDTSTEAPCWATATSGWTIGPSYTGTNRLTRDSRLLPGTYLRSPDGRFIFLLEYDGNLTLMGPAHYRLWDSGTSGNCPASLVMQADGNLVLYGPDGACWSSATDGTDADRLQIQDDGNAVIYGPSSPRWATDTAGKA